MTMTRESFGHSTTATELVELWQDSIKGKTILVTGVSPSGLGAELVLSLAAASPKLLILAGRNPSKIAQTSSAITKKYPGVQTRALELDLGSLTSCRTASSEVMSWDDVPTIDVLYDNAAIMACPYGKTQDGFEAQFGTNHLGHFVFTMGIVDKIIAAKTATHSPRIVVIGSMGYMWGPVRFEDPGFEEGKVYDKWAAYGQSKTANILFAAGLAERLKSKGVLSFAVHPGMIMNTGLQQDMTQEELDAAVTTAKSMNVQEKNLQQGAATYIVAGFDQEIVGDNGGYLEDCNIFVPMADWARGKENADRLWELSEQLVGQKFAV